MAAVVEALALEIGRLPALRFCFFGHSLGAILAFACARMLRRHGLRLPDHLIVSARPAPHLRNPDEGVHELTDVGLLEEVRRRGGSSPQSLDEPKRMARWLPVIRADFALLRSYGYEPELPLECPMTAFAGSHDDRTSVRDLEEWRVHTSRQFGLETLDCGHFFEATSRVQVLRSVRRSLANSLEWSDATDLIAER